MTTLTHWTEALPAPGEAAYDAAITSPTAPADAAFAAGAAYAGTLSQCADIVRRYYPEAPAARHNHTETET